MPARVEERLVDFSFQVVRYPFLNGDEDQVTMELVLYDDPQAPKRKITVAFSEKARRAIIQGATGGVEVADASRVPPAR